MGSGSGAAGASTSSPGAFFFSQSQGVSGAPCANARFATNNPTTARRSSGTRDLGHRLDQLVDDLLRADLLQLRFVAEHEAVVEHRVGDVDHLVEADVG